MILQLFCSETYSKKNLRASTPWRNGSASDSRSEGCVFKSRRDQLFDFPAVNSSLSPCTVILNRKKAASIAGLNLLLNAVSSQFGTHSYMFKTPQDQEFASLTNLIISFICE